MLDSYLIDTSRFFIGPIPLHESPFTCSIGFDLTYESEELLHTNVPLRIKVEQDLLTKAAENIGQFVFEELIKKPPVSLSTGLKDIVFSNPVSSFFRPDPEADYDSYDDDRLSVDRLLTIDYNAGTLAYKKPEFRMPSFKTLILSVSFTLILDDLKYNVIDLTL